MCLRSWSFGTDLQFCERQIAAALDDVLESEGGRVLFLPFHLDPGIDDDLAVANRVMGRLSHRQNAAVLRQPCSPSTLAGIIANADLTLGMRLHSVIFSLAAKVPFVALEYDPKIVGLAELTGFQEFMLPFGGIESEVLAERMRRALGRSEGIRELAGTLVDDWRRRARENAAIAAEMLEQGADTKDYGRDAHALMGRLVMTQVAGNENLLERVRACYAALEQPVPEVRPLEIADRLVSTVRDFRIQVQGERQDAERMRRDLEGAWQELYTLREDLQGSRQEAGELRGELLSSRQEADGLQRDLQDARLATDAAQKRFDAESRKADAESRRAAQLSHDLQLAGAAQQRADAQLAWLTSSGRALQDQVARLESKTLGGIVKRALQLALDTLQLITPGPLRAAVRKHYLNWFYFRIYPERRAGAAQAQGRDN